MRLSFAALAVPCFASCGEDQPPDSEESDADTDADTDADSDSDSDTDEVFPVLAIGLDYRFGWDQTKGMSKYWCYPDGDDKESDPDCFYPYAIVTLSTVAYFSLDPDDLDFEQQVDAETCEFTALLNVSPSTFPAEGYDHEIPGPTGSTKTMWASWAGTLDIDEASFAKYAAKNEPECLHLDPEWFPSGDPIEYLDGMRVGLGVGELTDAQILDHQKGWEDEAPYRLDVYTAINHPDVGGGVTFVGYDWSYGHLWNWDKDLVMTDEDDDGFLDPQDVTVPIDLSGVVFSNANWLEDFERNGEQILDPSLLKSE
jgi:hypothetical protein